MYMYLGTCTYARCDDEMVEEGIGGGEVGTHKVYLHLHLHVGTSTIDSIDILDEPRTSHRVHEKRTI